VDGASPGLDVLCEAWAHQGRAKAAQKNKLLADALKLTLAALIVGGTPRLYLVVSDEEAVVHLRGRAWAADALCSAARASDRAAGPARLSSR
jgi:hypothetical protein